MGYAIVMGFCVACKASVQFNPHKVPSIRVNGTREPLCRRCAERWSEIHKQPVPTNLDEAYAPMAEENL